MRGVTELHLHLEGSVTIDTLIALARARGHRWGHTHRREIARSLRFRGFGAFLALIRESCAVVCSYEGLARAAHELSLHLARTGVLYAEVYCSPFIYVRWGLSYAGVFDALDRGFALGEEQGGARCSILLDSVRQWGVDAACNVLGGFEQNRIDRVVGFGLGGEESVPLAEFAAAYDTARSLGLRTVAHAGEAGPASDVQLAIDVLGVDRIAHGIRALDDPALIAEIARRGIPLDIAVTSNYRTAVVHGVHPVRQLVDAGVRVTLSTDDPSLFRTTLPREYRRAARLGHLTPSELARIARDGVDAAFAPAELKSSLHAALDALTGETESAAQSVAK